MYGGFVALNYKGLVVPEKKKKALFAGELFREDRKRQLTQRTRLWGRRWEGCSGGRGHG